MVVVFPEPLLPRNPKVSPAWTSKDRSLMTVVSPKSIRKSLMCTRASSIAAPDCAGLPARGVAGPPPRRRGYAGAGGAPVSAAPALVVPVPPQALERASLIRPVPAHSRTAMMPSAADRLSSKALEIAKTVPSAPRSRKRTLASASVKISNCPAILFVLSGNAARREGEALPCAMPFSRQVPAVHLTILTAAACGR